MGYRKLEEKERINGRLRCVYMNGRSKFIKQNGEYVNVKSLKGKESRKQRGGEEISYVVGERFREIKESDLDDDLPLKLKTDGNKYIFIMDDENRIIVTREKDLVKSIRLETSGQSRYLQYINIRINR